MELYLYTWKLIVVSLERETGRGEEEGEVFTDTWKHVLFFSIMYLFYNYLNEWKKVSA